MRSRARGTGRLGAVALLALLACSRSEPPVHPFLLTVTDAAGQPVVPADGSQLVCAGRASLLDATTLAVDNTSSACPGGRVTLHFEPVEPDVVFPADLGGAQVVATVRGLAAARAPHGASDPWYALRLAAGAPGTEVLRLLLAEGELRGDRGLPFLPLGPETPDEDVPTLDVVPSAAAFEPSGCGDLYRDRLHVTSAAGDDVAALGGGERASAPSVAAGQNPWTVLHVQSWHRAGPDDAGGAACTGALRAWTQAALWR